MSEWIQDGGVLTAICGLMLACCLTGFGLGWCGGCGWAQRRESRRQARLGAAMQGGLRDVSGPAPYALYARTKGEPFTDVLKRHGSVWRDRV